jgi:hypothetical protein
MTQRDPLGRLVAFLLVLYAAWYLVLAVVIPLPLAINGLLDDSFYYLQVARNVARGLGSSFDGVTLTNGYHPLWMFLLVPVHLLAGSDPGLCIRLGLILCASFGMGGLVRVRGILRSHAGPWTAAAGLLLFAWPRFFGQTVSLLETACLLFLHLTVIGILVGGRPGRRSRALLGLFLGLACLARLDTIFLVASVAALGIVHAARGQDCGKDESGRSDGRTFPARLWGNLWFLGISIAVVAPYLLWNLAVFGRLQPISGAIKSTFPHPHPHWRYLRAFPEFTLLLLIGSGYLLASLRRHSSRLTRALGFYGLAAIFHMIYTLLFLGWGVDRWHFALLIPLGILGIPVLFDRFITRLESGGSRGFTGGRPVFHRWSILLVGLVLAVSVQAYSIRVRSGRHLAAVREAALWARGNLPADAVFGMSDSGVFAYFSRRTTVNLDGLVNNFEYLDMLRQGRLEQYLRERDIGYILDVFAYGNPEVLSGTYESRVLRFWYRPAQRVAGQIVVFRQDEVYRRDLLSRRGSALPPEPNAIILYRYRPEAQW